MQINGDQFHDELAVNKGTILPAFLKIFQTNLQATNITDQPVVHISFTFRTFITKVNVTVSGRREMDWLQAFTPNLLCLEEPAFPSNLIARQCMSVLLSLH